MKILLISNGFPPRHWAGTETYTAGIARELTRRGHQVYVICIGDWITGPKYYNGYSDEEDGGVWVRRFNLNWWRAPNPSAYLYKNPMASRLVSETLREIEPGLVHVTSCETLSASVVEASKDAGLPVVLSLTDFWFLCPRINLLRSDGELSDGCSNHWECLCCMMRETKVYRWTSWLLPESLAGMVLVEASRHPSLTRLPGFRGLAINISERKAYLRRILQQADRRITASQFVRDTFAGNGILDPILVQPYGHDLSWVQGYRGKTRSRVLRIGYIGQISEQKGVHLLLQAARRLDGLLGKRLTVSVYGNVDKDPAYGAQLRALAEGTDAIRFCGTYKHEESGAVFADLDVLVVPSIWYDFPLIIHEAFATQTPVIATNIGGMAETVHDEKNGLLVERADVDGLARQLRRLVEETGLLEKLQSGIGPVKTIHEEIDELEEVYGELVGQR